MKLFHISDVLSVTTGRLVSNRHMAGVSEILDFLTSDCLFTHQLPRAMRECQPWLKSQFPTLMEDSPGMGARLADMDTRLTAASQDRDMVIDEWVECLRLEMGLPDMLPVYELGADMHTRIDPIEELSAMIGDDKVIAVRIGHEPR